MTHPYMTKEHLQDLIDMLDEVSESTPLIVGVQYTWISGVGLQYRHTEVILSAKAFWGIMDRSYLKGDDRLLFLTFCLDLCAEADRKPTI